MNDIVGEDGTKGNFVVSIVPSSENELANRLLTGAKVEDMGSVVLYTYATQKVTTDFSDLEDVSGGVKFDKKNGLVRGDAKPGTMFTYKLDTVYPFQTLRVQAKQTGNKENQVRLEYSFDKNSWKDVASVQDKGEPRMFDDVISAASEGSGSVVYFRVSYSGEKDKKDTFGLDSFRVTALLNEPARLP